MLSAGNRAGAPFAPERAPRPARSGALALLPAGAEPARRDPAGERAARLARLRAACPEPEAACPPRVARPLPEAEAETGPGTGAGLDGLRGLGPGLAWALGRAGIADLADLARLEPGELAARLGPSGRLVPARAWIAAAREAAASA